MRRFISAVLLIVAVYAAQPNQDFQLRLKEPVYSNVPPEFRFTNGTALREVIRDALKASPRALGEGIKAALNDYSDKIFTNLDNLMIADGFDPAHLPDVHQGFDYTLIIEYTGELSLTKGHLDDLSTVHRGGDVALTYSSKKRFLEITVPITFNDLRFDYNYVAKIMGLGPVGGIEGKIRDLHVEVKLGFDTENLKASLDEFYITHAGHIDFLFNGNVLIDWLFNLLSEIVTTLLKEVVLLEVEGTVRGAIGQALDAINSSIEDFLDPNQVPAKVLGGL